MNETNWENGTFQTFPMENGKTIRLFIPKGMTKGDVERMKPFLNTLVLEAEGWEKP